jgi:hypothetical protein
MLLNNAIGLSKRGNEAGALMVLGQALHTAEDVIAHRGLGNLVETVFSTQRLLTHTAQDNSVDAGQKSFEKEFEDQQASRTISFLLRAMVFRFNQETGRR